MIEQLKEHIDEKEIKIIKDLIIRQYGKYKKDAARRNRDVFLDEYAAHHQQHNISWAISSAFPENLVIGNNLGVRHLEYGRGHIRPLISNDKIEVLVLNKGTDLNSKMMKEKYKLNANNFSKECLFCYIQFEATEKVLRKITLCLPNDKGVVIAEKVLLDNRHRMMKIA